ncbi:hypothetical protein GUJ93_ZPchr0978g40 [Zizania palustris]|uniref:Uncharacterized protein n=1 Tax=Zizania palustris TaxID=103762 RepID=A0A8J5RTI3_ZIZPA|nr:hypothetical protein GUJ93_ZPchr0978g40 [Zizania palustris]
MKSSRVGKEPATLLFPRRQGTSYPPLPMLEPAKQLASSSPPPPYDTSPPYPPSMPINPARVPPYRVLMGTTPLA